MKKNESYLIIGGILLILFLYLISNFTLEKIDDHNYYKKFSLKGEEPYDLSIFKKMLENYFTKDSVDLKVLITDYNDLDTNTLYINTKNTNYFYNDNATEILDFIKKGGKALFINKEFNIFEPDTTNVDTSYVDEMLVQEDSIVESLETSEDSIADQVESDSINVTNSAEILDTLSDSIDNVNEEADYVSRYKKLKDTIFHYRNKTFSYVPKIKDGKSDSLDVYIGELFTKMDTLIKSKSGDAILLKAKIGKGTLLIHLAPEMFSNIASTEKFYLNHFNQVMGEVKANKVYFNIKNSSNTDGKESPITHILSNKQLSTAYYLALAMLLLYFMFNIKRKQRAIPIYSKLRNTSLQYVGTLSRLFQLQDQNHKLALKMKDNFATDMKNKYYLDINSESFVNVLAKKKNIEESQINEILKLFKNIEKTNYCDDEELNKLYLLIENLNSKEI